LLPANGTFWPDATVPALIFSQAEVCAFLEGVKDGDFDDLL
jgi:hypothetical protein